LPPTRARRGFGQQGDQVLDEPRVERLARGKHAVPDGAEDEVRDGAGLGPVRQVAARASPIGNDRQGLAPPLPGRGPGKLAGLEGRFAGAERLDSTDREAVAAFGTDRDGCRRRGRGRLSRPRRVGYRHDPARGRRFHRRVTALIRRAVELPN
jgi:hypothetical protein